MWYGAVWQASAPGNLTNIPQNMWIPGFRSTRSTNSTDARACRATYVYYYYHDHYH